MANVNVQGILTSTTGLTKALVQNYFIDTNAPNSQLLASVTVSENAETALNNSTTSTPFYIPVFDNGTGLTIAITQVHIVQLYQAGQNATVNTAGVFGGASAGTAVSNFALASQKTPLPTTTPGGNPWPAPGTGPLFTTGILQSGPTAFTTFTTGINVNAGTTSGSMVYGDRNFNVAAFTNGAVGTVAQNVLLPNQTLYVQNFLSGTTATGLTVTQQFKVFIEGVFLPL